MKPKVYTVYDSKVSAYTQPFFLRTKGEALRGWMDVVNDGTTAFNKHPEDYTLFEIAEWDDQTAQFINHNTPVSIATALEVHQGYQNNPAPSESGAFLGAAQ